MRYILPHWLVSQELHGADYLWVEKGRVRRHCNQLRQRRRFNWNRCMEIDGFPTSAAEECR